jgi:hypothetical protein
VTAGSGEVLTQHEDDLRLDAWVDERVERRRHTRRQHHGVGEPRRQRRVDAHPLLLRPRGEPQLHADHVLAGCRLACEQGVLRPVGEIEVEPGELLGDRSTVAALGLRGQQLVDDPFHAPGGHAGAPVVSRSRSTCSATSMIMSSWPPT